MLRLRGHWTLAYAPSLATTGLFSPADLMDVEVPGYAHVREDGAGLFIDIPLAVAARDMCEQELPDTGVMGQLRRLDGSQVPELTRQIRLDVKIRRLNHQTVGAPTMLNQAIRATTIAYMDQARSGSGRAQNIIGRNDLASGQSHG